MTGRLPPSGRSPGTADWDDEPGDPLVERLQRLAAQRGPADDEEIARVAAATRAAFEAAAAGWRSGEEAVPRPAVTSTLVPPRRRVTIAPRRLPAGLAAAAALMLLFAGLGTVATVQAGPGNPLYALRVALEGLLLPGQPAARLDAQLGRLDGRLAEAGQAVDRGDWPAAVDALRAYARIAADAAGAGPGDAALERVRLQCAAIRQMRALRGSEPAAPDIGAAEAACAGLVRALGGPVATPPAGTPAGMPSPVPSASPDGSPGGGSPPSAGPPGSGTPGGSTAPGSGGKASPSPRPGSTSGPGGGSAGTPDPGGSGPSPAPGGPGGGSSGGGSGSSSPAPDPSGGGSGPGGPGGGGASPDPGGSTGSGTSSGSAP